jgi:hypothetical protein
MDSGVVMTNQFKQLEKVMGFSLEQFFRELEEILAKDQKAARTVRELSRIIERKKKYAEECGQFK